jgi:hypothetical protein
MSNLYTNRHQQAQQQLICTYIYIYKHTHTHTHTHIYVFPSLEVLDCIHIYTYVFPSKLYIYMCVCVCVCVYIYTYISVLQKMTPIKNVSDNLLNRSRALKDSTEEEPGHWHTCSTNQSIILHSRSQHAEPARLQLLPGRWDTDAYRHQLTFRHSTAQGRVRQEGELCGRSRFLTASE